MAQHTDNEDRIDGQRSPTPIGPASLSRAGRAYLQELRSIPPLTRKEELDLANRIEHGERVMLCAMVRVPALAHRIRQFAQDALGGRVRLDRVMEATPGDELTGARLKKLLRDAANDDEALQGLRVDRRFLDDLAAQMGADAGEVRSEVARGRRLAEAAKSELVRRHLWLVATIAMRHPSRGVDLLDLVQEGNIGLLTAADRYRARRGFRFGTYAAWWVRQAMHRAAAEQGHAVRLPVQAVEAATKASWAALRMTQQTGVAPSEDALSKETALPVDRLRLVQAVVEDAIRFDAPCGSEPGRSVIDDFPSEAVPRADEVVEAQELACATESALETLTEREQNVIRLRFGFDDEERSRDEVAAVFSLTRERIRQIEGKAIERLRHPTRLPLLMAVR